MKKYVNGQYIEMTAEEIEEINRQAKEQEAIERKKEAEKIAKEYEDSLYIDDIGNKYEKVIENGKEVLKLVELHTGELFL